MTTEVRIEIYKSRARVTPWTWRMRAKNGRIVANAAEDFDKAGNARRAALRIGAMIDCEVRVLDIDGSFDVLRKPSDSQVVVQLHGELPPMPPFPIAQREDAQSH